MKKQKLGITQPLLLGFALTEAVGLVALCMAFLILFFYKLIIFFFNLKKIKF